MAQQTILSDLYKEIQMAQSTKFSYTLAALGQPFETMRGIKAKLISYEASLEKPLIVQVGDQVYNYTMQGKRSRSGRDVPLDLRMTEVKAPPKEINNIRYINISYYEENDINEEYKVGVYIHKTRKEAYNAAREAKNVRIVAMPVPFSFKTDEIKLHSFFGDVLTYPEDVARKLMEVRK